MNRNLRIHIIAFSLVASSTICHLAAQGRESTPKSTNDALTYRFLPINPRWVVQENFQKPSYYDGVMTAYEGVYPKSEREKRKFFRELRYFEPRHQKDPNDFVKVVTYRPDGTLSSQSDRIRQGTHTDEWSADYYSNHKLSSRIHWRDGKWLSGYSVSPDRKTRTQFDDGTGHITFRHDGGTQEQQWLHAGAIYLIRVHTKDRLLRTELILPGKPYEHLLLTTSGEDLLFNGQRGLKAVGQPGTVYPLGQAPPMLVTRSRTISAAERAAQRQQDQIRYGRLRADFLQQYEAFLKSIGQSFQSLGLQDVRNMR